MKLSLYIHLFEREGVCYLFNSKTNFFSTIDRTIYESLYDGEFDKIPNDIIKILKDKEIIVEDKNIYDYYYEKKLYYYSSIGNFETLELVIAPTTFCNFACPYCFEGEKQNKRMSKEIINELVPFINKFQSTKKLNITWYGGEPLLAFDIMKDIVTKIKSDSGIIISSQSIVTNGYLINDEVINFMKTNDFESIQISFDGIREHHNQTRNLKGNGKPSFDKILANVERLVTEMPDNTKIVLRVNINKKNEGDFSIMYKSLSERFLGKKVVIYPGFIREEGKGNNQMCYSSLFGQSRFDFYKKIAAKGIIVDFYPKLQDKCCMTCRNNSFIIGPEGEMYKCWSDFNNPDKIVGNIKDKSMTNPQLLSRYVYDATLYNDPKCKECKLFPICDGGCSWFRYKNIFEGKKYDLCTFLSDDARLEECLLKKQPAAEDVALRAY